MCLAATVVIIWYQMLSISCNKVYLSLPSQGFNGLCRKQIGYLWESFHPNYTT